MASSKPVLCGPCKQGKVNTKADIWCNNCDEGLCSTCSSHHKRIKSSRDHKTIDIQTYTSHKPATGLIKAECDAHSLQFNLYCPSHLMPCCDECISTSHSKCTGITNLASVVEKTKIDKFKESVEKNINSIRHFLDKMVNNKSDNLKRGEQQYEIIKQSVSKIRNEINKHIDHLEEKLCKKADTVWSQEKTKLTSLITEIEDKKKTLKELQDDLDKVAKHTLKLKSFLGVHQIEQKVYEYQRFVQGSERSSEVDIKLMPTDEIEQVLSKIQSLTSLGVVKIVKTEISLNRKTGVSRNAQVESQPQFNINNITMNIEKNIKINMGKKISDTICLMDERVIVVETVGNVNLFTSDGKLQKQLTISDKAWSVTQMKQDTIAISYPGNRVIRFFNMENETVIKVITLNKTCFGLSSSNNSLAVGLSYDEIRIIDLEGNTQKSIQVDCTSFLFYIVYSKDRVIYGDWNGKTVYCVNESGKQIWRYKQDLSEPRGLCVDTYGNIIVADFRSDEIIVISKDGQDSKKLVRKIDPGYPPFCICFNKHKDSYGFICNADGNNIIKFNLSYD